MDLGSAIGLVGNMTEDADETAITLKRDEKSPKLVFLN